MRGKLELPGNHELASYYARSAGEMVCVEPTGGAARGNVFEHG